MYRHATLESVVVSVRVLAMMIVVISMVMLLGADTVIARMMITGDRHPRHPSTTRV